MEMLLFQGKLEAKEIKSNLSPNSRFCFGK